MLLFLGHYRKPVETRNEVSGKRVPEGTRRPGCGGPWPGCQPNIPQIGRGTCSIYVCASYDTLTARKGNKRPTTLEDLAIDDMLVAGEGKPKRCTLTQIPGCCGSIQPDYVTAKISAGFQEEQEQDTRTISIPTRPGVVPLGSPVKVKGAISCVKKGKADVIPAATFRLSHVILPGFGEPPEDAHDSSKFLRAQGSGTSEGAPDGWTHWRGSFEIGPGFEGGEVMAVPGHPESTQWRCSDKLRFTPEVHFFDVHGNKIKSLNNL